MDAVRNMNEAEFKALGIPTLGARRRLTLAAQEAAGGAPGAGVSCAQDAAAQSNPDPQPSGAGRCDASVIRLFMPSSRSGMAGDRAGGGACL